MQLASLVRKINGGSLKQSAWEPVLISVAIAGRKRGVKFMLVTN